MAEIHVEPKKNTSNTSWIWIVLVLLIAAAIVYYLMTRNKTGNNTTAPANTTGQIQVSPQMASHTLLL
jgi:flagellar basal body-associated protein FliL